MLVTSEVAVGAGSDITAELTIRSTVMVEVKAEIFQAGSSP